MHLSIAGSPWLQSVQPNYAVKEMDKREFGTWHGTCSSPKASKSHIRSIRKGIQFLKYQENQDPRPTRILLIDDDADFRKLMCAVALGKSVALDAYESLDDFASDGPAKDYTVAIVDYRLKDTTGIKTAQSLQNLLTNETPVVLASCMDRGAISESNWPLPIAKFVSKTAGCDSILQSALTVAIQHCPAHVRNIRRRFPDFARIQRTPSSNINPRGNRNSLHLPIPSP